MQRALGPLVPTGVDDLVMHAGRRWHEGWVEAVDLALEPVWVLIANGEHGAERTDLTVGGARRHQAVAQRAERLGVVPEPVVPWLSVGVAAAAPLIVAVVIALALSRRATAKSPAAVLKAE